MVSIVRAKEDIMGRLRNARTGNGSLMAIALLAIGLLVAAPALAQEEPGRGPGVRGGQGRGERVQRGGRFGGGQERGSGGQFRRGPGGFAGMFQPDFLRRDLTLISEHFELDADQRTIVETLLLDYEAEFTELSTAIRDEFTALRPRPANEPQLREQRAALIGQMREIRREVQALRETLPPGEQIDPEVMAKIRERLEPIRQEMNELRPRMPQGEEMAEMIEAYSTLAREWRSQRERLKASFTENLKSVLNETQAEQWPDFDRMLRRLKTIDQGRLSGEQVDLFRVVRDLGFGDATREAVDETLMAYAVDLDQALVARNSYLDFERGDFFQALAMGDLDRAVTLSQHETELRKAVRAVNERYAEAIAGVLFAEISELQAADFLAAYRRQAYPRIYRPSRMHRTFEVALELDDLGEEVAGSLRSLQTAFLDQIQTENRNLERLTKEHEPDDAVRRLRLRMARQRGGEVASPENPVQDAFRARAEMEQRYRDQVESLLTEEQIAQLPPMQRPFEQRDGRGRDRLDEERRARLLQRFDRNGDGDLSDEERQAMRDAMRADRGDRRRGRGGDGPPQ